MRYSLLLHYRELTPADLGPDGERQFAEAQVAMDTYVSDLDAAGVLISAEVLQPSSASTTITTKDGAPVVHDGPFADTKEQLGGTFVLDVPDLDAAIAWAEKSPALGWGSVEIRPSALYVDNGAWTSAE
jgi:hypothetical protein